MDFRAGHGQPERRWLASFNGAQRAGVVSPPRQRESAERWQREVERERTKQVDCLLAYQA
jgi:hypothetical protein